MSKTQKRPMRENMKRRRLTSEKIRASRPICHPSSQTTEYKTASFREYETFKTPEAAPLSLCSLFSLSPIFEDQVSVKT